MKATNYIVFFILLLCTISVKSFGQQLPPLNDTVEVMHVIGMAVENGIPVDGVSVKLFKANEELEYEEISSVPKHDHHFTFDLMGNAYYTIQVSKEGYATRSVGITTNVPETFVISEVNPKNSFELEVEIFKLKIGDDDEYVDFPIAMVKFNPKRGKFERDEAYTNKLKLKMGDIAEHAMTTSSDNPKKKK